MILKKSTCVPSCGTYSVEVNSNNKGSISYSIEGENTSMFDKELTRKEVEQLLSFARSYSKSDKEKLMTKDFNTYYISISGENELEDRLETIYPPTQEIFKYLNELIKKYKT
ncbi:hypothetical protein [Ekhidna sp.]|uniref:hypothetical protein n=1 Tax=Ekhidna sp. TaxID=2608089 RepID=UPI003CCBC5DD